MFAGQQFLNCVRSEIHNVLSTMRRNGRWASEERFHREIPLHYETPLIRAFKSLQDYLQAFDDVNDVDAVIYFKPFLDVVSYQNTNGAMTGRALSSINKFLLYGSLSQESPHAREAVNLAVSSIVECKFESTNSYSDEVVLMQLLEVIVNLLRCPAGPYITNVNVWKMVETCFRLTVERGTSVLLRSTAANSLTHIMLTIFSRASELITADTVSELLMSEELNFSGPPECGFDKIVDLYDGDGMLLEVEENAEEESDINFDRVLDEKEDESLPLTLGKASSTISAIRLTQSASFPASYGLPVLVKVISFLSDLTNPATNSDAVRILALQLINIVLETAGEALGTTSPVSRNQTPLVAVLQGDLCKFLLQNSQSDDLSVQSLTLRVVFNLFNAMKGHLKVQLEVFLISVHLRIAESTSASFERKELALESLLDFCREPALMLDLYTNYDCDFRCTNLFETLCKCLCRCAVPSPAQKGNVRLTSLNRLALEGILAVIEDIARRCLNANSSSIPNKSPNGTDGRHEEPNDACSDVSTDMQVRQRAENEDQFGWLESARERTAIVLRSRKQKKRRLLLAAKQFNKNPNKTYWIDYAKDIGVLPQEAAAHDISHFLLHTPGLDKTKVGEYLGDGPKEEKPFNTLVLESYIKQFDFKGLRIDLALRLVLESFRLPGEAQKVDRIMEAFGAHYYEQNKASEEAMEVNNDGAAGVFASADAAFIFAFSIIMLHTDLHNDQIRPDKKMRKADFIKNNRNINEGKNLPEHLLEEVYDSIKENQIRMLYDPHSHSEVVDFDHSSVNSVFRQGSGGPTWAGVLRHSETVDEASFTPSSLGRRCIFRAGVHERDMFLIIYEPSMSALAATIEQSSDGKMVTRALEGYRNLAKVAAYFEMIESFNHIMITMCRYFLVFGNSLTKTSPLDTDIEAIESLRDAMEIMHKKHVSSETSAMRVLKAEINAAHTECKALLTFQGFLSLAIVYGNQMRESWRNVIRCILFLHEAHLLPRSFVELDDITDSEGNVLPTTAKTRLSQSGISTELQQHKSEGVWNVLTSFLWSEPGNMNKDAEHAKFLVKEIISAFRLKNLFYQSRHLQMDSLMRLINSLSLPIDDSERNIVLCIELLSEIALSNSHRLGNVWESIVRVFMQTLANAGAIGLLKDSTSRSSSIPFPKVSFVVVERILVNLVRINMRMLETANVLSEELIEALLWLTQITNELASMLAPRVGEGMCTILRFNGINIRTARGWLIVTDILKRYAAITDSREAIWKAIEGLVESKCLHAFNTPAITEIILIYIQKDERESNAEKPGYDLRLSNNVNIQYDAKRPVEALGEVSRILFASESFTLNETGSSSRESLWVDILKKVIYLSNSTQADVRNSAFRVAEDMLWSPPCNISGQAWLFVFNEILFSAFDSLRTKDSETRIRITNIMAKTLLRNIGNLSRLSDFNLLWLRVINILSSNLRYQRDDPLFVTSLETLKNLLLVLRSEGLLRDTPSSADKTVWDLTWDSISSNCDEVKQDLASALMVFDKKDERIENNTDSGEQTNEYS